jgi:sugar lactone lactonase YvrE
MDPEARALSRRGAALVLLTTLAAASPGVADDYRAIHGRMVAAWQQEDMPALTVAIHDGLAVRPDYPPLLYNLAIAEDRLRRPAAALDILERLADMGLSFPADTQDFPALVAEPRFAPVAARLTANGQPSGTAEPFVVATGETEFLPEGIAIDPASGALFLGSVRQGRILRHDAAHGWSVFAADDPQHLWGVFGMAVAGDLLWVATSAVEEAASAPREARGLAAINAYRLADGTRIVHCPAAGPAVFGALLPDAGGVWISDSAGGVLWLDPASCRFKELVPPGAMVSPQGLASAGDAHLLVADYRGGLYRVSKADGTLQRVAVPRDVTVYGIDGLDRAGEWLLAVQNGITPHRVIALRLAPDGTRITAAKVLAAALPEFDEPTLGVVYGERFLFVANSGWPHYAAGATSTPQTPLVMSVPLPVER